MIDNLYFRQLDGMRCLAIMAVMAAHFAAASPLAKSIPFGSGVHFFFVLSSFLITRILILDRQAVNEKNGSSGRAIFQFYARRFLRIFPAYYLFIGVMYALNWSPMRESIWWALSFTVNFRLVLGHNLGMFSHLWSLAAEEQAYLLMPLLIFFTPKKYFPALFGLLTVAGLLGRAWLYHLNPGYIPYSNFHLISCMDSFGLGGMLAMLFLSDRPLLDRLVHNRLLFVLAVLAWAAIVLIAYAIPEGEAKYNFFSVVVLRFFTNLLSFLVLGIGVTRGFGGLAGKLLESRIFIYIGRISYGIYLYHLVIPNFIARLADHLGRPTLQEDLTAFPLFSFLLYGSVSVAVATASWYMLEKPFNNLKRFFKYGPAPESRATRIVSPRLNSGS